MRQDIIHWDVWKKIKFVERLIEESIGVVNGDDLYTMLGRISHYHYTTRQHGLKEKELMIYEILIKNDLNPSTVYKWYCLTRTPQDLQQRIRSGKINQKQALRMTLNRRREKEMGLAMQVLTEGRDVIRRL